MSDGRPSFDKRTISHYEEVESRLESCLLYGRLWRFPVLCSFVIFVVSRRYRDGPEVKKNDLSAAEIEMFLGLMQQVTYPRTEEGFKKGVAALKRSRVNKDHVNLHTCVENTWLSCSFHWAQAFRKQQAINIINTNNGTARSPKQIL